MKSTTASLSVLLLVMLLNGFTTVSQGNWGEWRTTLCYGGLDYCVRKTSYNQFAKKYEWWVKFRNRYDTNVTFNCVLKASYVTTAKTTDRVTVRANTEGGSTWFLVDDSNAVNLFVGQLRFGNDEWGSSYAACDQ